MRKFIMLLEGTASWLVCVTLTVCMMYFASLWLRQNVADQLSNRYYNVMLAELKERIESGLKLGVELVDVPGIQNTLRKMRDRDHSLYALEVIGTDNVVVFSTDRGSIGEVLPDSYLPALARAWSFSNPYETFHTVKIQGSFGESAGQVLLSASRQKFSVFGVYRLKMVMGFFLAILVLIIGWLFYLGRLFARQVEADVDHSQQRVDDYLGDIEERLNSTFAALQALEKRYS